LAVAATLLVACGSGAGSTRETPTDAGGLGHTYSNTAEGFSIPLEGRFHLYREGMADQQKQMWEAALVDSKIITTNGHKRWAGYIEIRVIEHPTFSQAWWAKNGFSFVMRGFTNSVMATTPGAKVVKAPHWARLAGTRAVALTYLLPRGTAATDRVTEYAFLGDKRWFAVLLGAPTVSSKAEQPLFDQVMADFRLLGSEN